MLTRYKVISLFVFQSRAFWGESYRCCYRAETKNGYCGSLRVKRLKLEEGIVF
jgi:hypothetical protein